MKHISLLLSVIFLTGCAASMSELITEAKECTKTSINPQGVIGKPTDEQSGACWAGVNKKLEAQKKSEKRREIAKQCCIRPNGKPMMNCKCISAETLEEALRRSGYY